MKKTALSFVFAFILIVPIIVITFVYLIMKYNTFTKPEFWYAYMAYFGTVLLAGVSFWQNENANKTNERLTKQQLQQKIGYLDLKGAENEEYKLNKYQNVQIGQVYDMFENKPLLNHLILNVTNVGEDIILNPKILCCEINGRKTDVKCIIGMIYLDETIKFDLGSVNSNDKTLNIKLIIEMNNISSIKYKQILEVSLKRNNNDKNIYSVYSFNTEILFIE